MKIILNKNFLRIGAKWTDHERNYLENEWRNGSSLENIATELKRTTNAICCQINLLKLDSITGRYLPPSIYQTNLIEKLEGQNLPPSCNRKEASKIIDELITQNGWKLETSSSQIKSLNFLGYLGVSPKNMQEAQKLIQEYVSKNVKKCGICDISSKTTFEWINLLKKLKRENSHGKQNYEYSEDDYTECNPDVEECPGCAGVGCEYCDDSGSEKKYNSSLLHGFNPLDTDDDL